MPGYIPADRARNETLKVLDEWLGMLPEADRIAVLARLLNDVEDRWERLLHDDEEVD